MDDGQPEPEPEKPRFLLPDGCKDLFDVLRLQEEAQRARSPKPVRSAPSSVPSGPLPSSVALPDPVIVRDLAVALGIKPFRIVGSFLQLGVFVSLNQTVNFETASAVCTLLGVPATKLA